MSLGVSEENVILRQTPILMEDSSIRVLCRHDAFQVDVKNDGNIYSVFISNYAVTAILKNNYTVWSR
ncbi:hypothetical protein D3C85_194960 [compost metagenome]